MHRIHLKSWRNTELKSIAFEGDSTKMRLILNPSIESLAGLPALSTCRPDRWPVLQAGSPGRSSGWMGTHVNGNSAASDGLCPDSVAARRLPRSQTGSREPHRRPPFGGFRSGASFVAPPTLFRKRRYKRGIGGRGNPTMPAVATYQRFNGVRLQFVDHPASFRVGHSGVIRIHARSHRSRRPSP
jgi:hypothetical protein